MAYALNQQSMVVVSGGAETGRKAYSLGQQSGVSSFHGLGAQRLHADELYVPVHGNYNNYTGPAESIVCRFY